jgi:hypothetical protein
LEGAPKSEQRNGGFSFWLMMLLFGCEIDTSTNREVSDVATKDVSLKGGKRRYDDVRSSEGLKSTATDTRVLVRLSNHLRSKIECKVMRLRGEVRSAGRSGLSLVLSPRDVSKDEYEHTAKENVQNSTEPSSLFIHLDHYSLVLPPIS